MPEVFPYGAAGPLPAGPFGCILADPPWTFRTWSAKGDGRSARRHYQTLTLEQIKALPVASVAARDCLLLLWSLNSMIPQALEVITAWGFTLKTVGFTWAKQTRRGRWHVGTGYWTRQNTERVLLASRGKPKRLSAGVRELIVAPRSEHSRKPQEQYAEIEALVAGPYLELFARQRQPGWTAWGDSLPPATARTRHPNREESTNVDADSNPARRAALRARGAAADQRAQGRARRGD